MPRKTKVWHDRHIVVAFGTLCLAMVLLAGCTSKSTAQKPAAHTPTPTPATRSAFILPAGFTMYKGADFHLAYPVGWAKKDPENGKGVQYGGPKDQEFIVASLGNLPSTPQAFDKAFCSPTGFGGAPEGAATTVKIGGENWVQQECVDNKTDKTATVAATVHNKAFYYMVYGSPSAGYKNDVTQYYHTMEQSFSFAD